MMRESGLEFSDFQRILVHQATLPYLDEMLDATGIPADRVECTVGELGNMASASLPVAYSLAQARGAIKPGDRVMWLGLASGISVGLMMMEV
jgi:3-oxoacyl-[acyl-carrier-protein] synthase-3